MIHVVLRRLSRVVPVLLIVSFLTLGMSSLLPGGPAVALVGDHATAADVAAVNHAYGFDSPLIVRYGRWMKNVAKGDFGESYRTHQKVRDAIVQRIPITLELAIGAELIALTLSILLGSIAAARAGSLLDRILSGAMSWMVAVPGFLAALLLVYVFSLRLGWTPVTGWSNLSDGIGPNLRSAILPMSALALPEIAAYQRILRNDVLATLQEEYILMARSKGLSDWFILLRHALRPSSFSLITLSGVSFGRLIAGAVIVEQIFALPGLGQLVARSVGEGRDFIMVQGIVMFIAIVYVSLNVLVDVLYGVVDPRVRTS